MPAGSDRGGFADIKPRLTTLTKGSTVTPVVRVTCPYGCGSKMTQPYDAAKPGAATAAQTTVTRLLKAHMLQTCPQRPKDQNAK